MVEVVQPYNGTQPGGMGAVLEQLGDLDNLDKHREFLTTVSVVKRAETSGHAVLDDQSIKNMKMKFTNQRIRHDAVVAVCYYDPPLNEADPNLKLTPVMSLARGMPLEGYNLLDVLWQLWQRTSTYITGFRDFFPNFPN